jgi:hypothetical protein
VQDNRAQVEFLYIFHLLSPGKKTGTEESLAPKQLWTKSVHLGVAQEFVSQLDIKSDSYSRSVYLVGKIDTAGVEPDICAGLENDTELALVNTGKVSFIHDKKKL